MSVQNQLVWGISRKYKRTLVLVHQKGQKRLLFSFLKDKICQCRHLWHLLLSLLHIVQSLPEPWRWVHLQISGDEQLYRKSIGGLKSTDTDPCSCWNMMKCGFSATCYPIVILQLWGAAGVKQTKGLKLSFTVRCVCVCLGPRQACRVGVTQAVGTAWGEQPPCRVDSTSKFLKSQPSTCWLSDNSRLRRFKKL